VLLVHIIERLFAERRFRLFDFGGMASDYKAFFATGSIAYVKVFWFPINLKHLMLVSAHYFVLRAWQGAGWLKSCARTGWVSGARYLARWSAQIHRSRAPAPAKEVSKQGAHQLRP